MRHILGPVLLMFLLCLATLPASGGELSCQWSNSGHVVCAGAVATRVAHHHRRAARHRTTTKTAIAATTPLPRPRPDANGNTAAKLDRHADGYCHPMTSAGRITIACWLAPKMVGFINDAYARGFRGRVNCLSYGRTHVPGSLHFIAEACDFAQRGWGKTVAVMYHVGDLASKWGLRNGCSFGDCGHIDSGRIRTAHRHREPWPRVVQRETTGTP